MSNEYGNQYFNKLYSHTFKEVNRKYKIVDLKKKKIILQKLYSNDQVKISNENKNKPNMKELQLFMNKVCNSMKNLENEINEFTFQYNQFTLDKIPIHRNQSSSVFKIKPKIIVSTKTHYLSNNLEKELVLKKAQTSVKTFPNNYNENLLGLSNNSQRNNKRNLTDCNLKTKEKQINILSIERNRNRNLPKKLNFNLKSFDKFNTLPKTITENQIKSPEFFNNYIVEKKNVLNKEKDKIKKFTIYPKIEINNSQTTQPRSRLNLLGETEEKESLENIKKMVKKKIMVINLKNKS